MKSGAVSSPWRPSVPQLVVKLKSDGISAMTAKALVVDYLGGCTGDVPPWRIVAARLKDSPTGSVVIPISPELFSVIMPTIQPSSSKTRAILQFDVAFHNASISREDATALSIADLLNEGRLELDILVDPSGTPQVLSIDLSV